MAKFDSSIAQLRLAILQTRLQSAKGKMTAAMQKINMKQENPDKYPDWDLEQLKLEFEAANQRSFELEQNLTQEEDFVLEKTKQ